MNPLSVALLTSQHSLDDIRGIITFGVYHRSSWILLGHAVRLATDMRLDTAFATLLATGMGRDLNTGRTTQEQELVGRARLWFSLFAHEYQTSFANGRTPVIRADESFDQCRQFLDHPSSTSSDIRLIAIVELLILRSPLHLKSISPTGLGRQTNLIEVLDGLKVALDDWFDFYDGCFETRLLLPPSSYYRESLRASRDFALVFANALVFQTISSKADLRRLSDEEYGLALRAVRCCQTGLETVTKGQSYPRMLKFAIPHTHMTIAFAASFFLRAAPLFPDRFDRNEMLREVGATLELLADCGASGLARALRRILVRSEQDDSGATNPTREGLPLINPSLQDAPNTMLPDFDLSTIFNGSVPGADMAWMPGFNENDFSLDEFWNMPSDPVFMQDLTHPS